MKFNINSLLIDIDASIEYNIQKRRKHMRKRIYNYHQKIDILAVTFLLYFLGVLGALQVFKFIHIENIRIFLTLITPLLICKRKTVVTTNEYLHRFLRLRR